MAVSPTITPHGLYTRYEWVLTATDQVAEPTYVLGMHNEKSVDVHGEDDADGFNGATVEVHGSLDAIAAGVYKLCNTVPDTLDLQFVAAATRIYTILPHVLRIKPVVTNGTVGAVGVRVVMLATGSHRSAL